VDLVVASTERVALRRLVRDDMDELLVLARESRELHHPWAYPPERPEQIEDLLARSRRDDFEGLLACRAQDGAIAGIFNVSQIIRGAFQSAFLGYYAHARHAGRGYMREGLALVLAHAFGPLALHRLEVNIQPGNVASAALAKGAGFRLEGYSPRYLLVGGSWRDHERYAIVADELRSQNNPS